MKKITKLFLTLALLTGAVEGVKADDVFDIIKAPAGTTDLALLTGTEPNWANTVVYPKELAVQGAAFGNGEGSNESTHVDISSYDYLCFYIPEASANSVALRVWIWNGSSVTTLFAHPIANYATANYTQEHRISAGGTYVVKISDYQHLKGVKAANNWGAPSVTVQSAWVSTGDAPIEFNTSNSLKGKNLSFVAESYCAATWTEGTKTFTWGSGGMNTAWTFMAAQGISGDLSEWTGMHLKVSDFTNSVENKLKVVFKSGGQSGPTSEFTVAPDAKGNIEIDLTNAGGNCDFTNVFDVTIYGLERTDPSQDGSVKVTEAWLYKPDDPLALSKNNLKASIAAGEKESAIGRTAASFANLTTAISNAKDALADNNATAETLAAAKTAVDEAIAGLELAEGYTPLTADMFKHWDDNLNPVVGTPASCAFNLNTSTGQAFGDNSVRYLYFADLSCYDKLILYVSEGTPRIMLNRKDPGNGGGDANGGSYIQLTDDPVGGAVVVDLKDYEFAHLNAIKGKNGGNVTITGIVLQERVFNDPLIKGPDGTPRDWIGLNRKWVRDAIANAEKIDLSLETDEELIYNLRRAIAIARKVAYTRCDPANPDAIIAAMDAARRDLKAAVEAFQKEEASDVERVYATFENPSNTNTTWNAATKTFTWSTTYYNQLRNIGLPNGNISKYRKLVVNCTMNQGDRIRILFYKGGSNLTLYAHDGVNEFIIKDELEKLAPNDYNEYLLQCDEICLSGDNGSAPGEAVINSVYLETYSTATEKVFATFENPSNTNTTWNAETKTFTWSTTYYNQLRNIGLPNGDISKYKKLVVNCTMNQGDRFRILFYKGGSNLTLYAHDGINEFLIKDELEKLAPNDYNEYLLQCDEICLSGDNATAPGEAVINSVYLETYPATEVVDIPAIVEEQDPGKPEGSFVDLTASMFTGGNAAMNLGKKIGNGEMVYGSKSKDAFADLSNYAKLTIVATPGLKLVLNLNHEVDIKENQGDYSADDSGKYVWIDATVGENGIYELDLTQYGSAKLNNIRMPWDNSNKGTVWYLLLSAEAQTGRTATGVSEVKLNSDNAEIYNLNGQRVAAPQKGLNIINGKKVVIK